MVLSASVLDSTQFGREEESEEEVTHKERERERDITTAS